MASTRLATRRTYARRQPEHGALHRVVREHLETFLADVEGRADERGVPRFVERELRHFLTCGMLAHGFARFRCPDCRADRLVAPSPVRAVASAPPAGGAA